MKFFLHFPFLILFFIQVIIALLLKNDVIFLATAVKLGLFSTAFYSVCILLYAFALLPRKLVVPLGLLSGLIILTTFLKVYLHVEWLNWSVILLLHFIQIQLFLFLLIRNVKMKWSVMAVGTALFLSLLIQLLSPINIPFSILVILLSGYTLLIVISLISKNTVYEN